MGYFITSIIGGRWVDYIMAREARKANRVDSRGNLKYKPEDRMKENAWVGAIIFPAALIAYAWTAECKYIGSGNFLKPVLSILFVAIKTGST